MNANFNSSQVAPWSIICLGVLTLVFYVIVNVGLLPPSALTDVDINRLSIWFMPIALATVMFFLGRQMSKTRCIERSVQAQQQSFKDKQESLKISRTVLPSLKFFLKT